MKQYITIEDFRQLSERGQKAYRGQWGRLLGDAPYINIGQMIEFIGWEDMQFFLIPSNSTTRRKYKDNPEHLLKWHIQDGDYENAGVSYFAETLCDALWEAVKEKLNK